MSAFIYEAKGGTLHKGARWDKKEDSVGARGKGGTKKRSRWNT
jgi:hypothetical protein